jgi:hypothetical protein
MRRVRHELSLCPVACPLAAAALLAPRPAVPLRQPDPPRRRGRPRARGRERIVCQDRLQIPYDTLLARKAAQERRVITEREVRDVTGLSYERIKAIQRGDCAAVDLHEIEVLLTFFGCTLTELVQDTTRSATPRP